MPLLNRTVEVRQESTFDWRERGMGSAKGTGRESNLGRREHSCAMCHRTNHVAIGAD